jgi:opacity protein-like surface antigen
MEHNTMHILLKSSASAAVLALFMSAPALSADILGNGDPTSSDHAYKAAFQGLGIGVHGGGQFTNVEIGEGDFSFDGVGADGLAGGVHGEYLFAFGGSFRVGPYCEGGFSNVNTNVETPKGDLDLLNQEHYYGCGAKAGAVVGDALFYARIGVERSKWEFAEEIDVDVDSYVIGAGIEAMIADNVSLGLSGDYITPFNIEAEGHDLTKFFDETESFRGLVRLTYRR